MAGLLLAALLGLLAMKPAQAQSPAYFDTQRLVAAAALAPPQKNMHLVHLRCHAGATPGDFTINYDGKSIAHFPAPANGLAEYDLEFGIQGANIPVGSIAFLGGMDWVEATYSTNPGKGPPIDTYRGIRFARTDAGAVTADVTVAFDAGDSAPNAVIAHISASAGRVRFPATGSLQMDYEANPEEFLGMPAPVSPLPEAADLTLSVITDAAATIQAIVYY